MRRVVVDAKWGVVLASVLAVVDSVAGCMSETAGIEVASSWCRPSHSPGARDREEDEGAAGEGRGVGKSAVGVGVTMVVTRAGVVSGVTAEGEGGKGTGEGRGERRGEGTEEGETAGVVLSSSDMTGSVLSVCA